MKLTEKEDQVLRALLFRRGRSLRLRQMQDDISEVVNIDVTLDELRGMFKKLGLKEHTPDEKGLMYEGTELEAKVWSKLTRTTPIIYGGNEMALGEPSPEMIATGSGISPGSPLSIEEQRIAMGIIDVEPEHWTGKIINNEAVRD